MWNWLKKIGRAAQPQAAAPSAGAASQTTTQASANAVDTSQLEAMIETMLQSDRVDPELINQWSSLNDPVAIEKSLAKLKEMGADEVAPIMNIADYYRPRNIKYELRWPLSTPWPFDKLDEATQFHLLFAEWTRREMQGSFALNNGDLATAESAFNECLQRAEQLAVPELKARSYEGFMRIAQRKGNRAAEREWITAAKKTRAEAHMQIRQLTLMRDEAMIDFEEGRLPQAEAQLADILAKLRSDFSDNLYELCRTLINRATVLSLANRWEEALKDLSECADIGAQLKPVSRQSVLVNVYSQQAKLYGTAFSSIFNPDAARQAISNLQSLGYSDWIVDFTIVELAYEERDWQTAARSYRKLAKEWEANGWIRAMAACHLKSGRAFLELNELDAAADDLSEALPFFEKYGPPDILATAKMHMGRLRAARGDFEEAWQLAESALDLVESGIRKFGALFDQQRFVLDKLTNYQYAFAIALAKNGDEGIWRAWTVAERAKSFYLCQLVANGDIDLFEGVEPADLAKLRELEIQLDGLEARRSQMNGAEGDHLATIEAEFNRVSKAKEKLQESMMRTNPRWGALKTPPRLNLQAELKKLDSKWVPLSYFWQTRTSGATLHIFYADRDRHPSHASIEWSQADIDELNHHRETLRGVLPPFVKLFPGRIAEKILPMNIVNQIERVQRLLISPHDHLRMLPLHALRVDQNTRLIDLCPVQYIPTLALLQLRRTERAENILLMGCEQDGLGSPPLKHVPDELDTLYETWSSQTGKARKFLLASDSSPGACGLPLENWQDFDVLHFACHGEFPEDRPFDAALRLGNDAVRTSEFFGVRLKANLVSLSACALGRQTHEHSGLKLCGDEWIGLYLPLFYAGARCVVASLWDANSQVAALFMNEFHQHLSNDAGLAGAFQQAIISVAKKPEPFWTNWYLVGFPE